MNAEEIATGAKDLITDAPWEENENPDLQTRGVYLGSALVLDPCGCAHYMLSAGGHPDSICAQFWTGLRRQLKQRGLTLERGIGDDRDCYATEHRVRGERSPIQQMAQTVDERSDEEILAWLRSEREKRARALANARLRTRKALNCSPQTNSTIQGHEHALRNLDREIRVIGG